MLSFHSSSTKKAILKSRSLTRRSSDCSGGVRLFLGTIALLGSIGGRQGSSASTRLAVTAFSTTAPFLAQKSQAKSFVPNKTYSSFAHQSNFAAASPFTTLTTNMASTTDETVATTDEAVTKIDEEDHYIWLEDVESEESLNFAKDNNEKCLKALGDPKTSGTGTYDSVLEILESNDRIPYASKFGVNENGEDVLFNFWKDGTNPKGLWRKTTLNQYKSKASAEDDNANEKWTTVLDVDALGKAEDVSWVWKGARPLPRRRDDVESDMVTRALVMLSRGGADATIIREFDFSTNDFVKEEDGGFHLPEAKTRASYKSRDVVSVGTDFGPGSLTDSGYPRVVKEWVRGTPLSEAVTVFEGEKTDVSVSAYTDDQRFRDGPIYEVQARSMTFYTSKHWVRQIKFEHLLAPEDPRRESVEAAPEFVEVDVQEDADIDFYATQMLVTLRSDWTVGDNTYQTGSLLAVDYNSFLTEGKDKCSFDVLFEPTERTALETYSETKNYMLLSIMDNVKSKLQFLKLVDGHFQVVGGDSEAKIRTNGVRAYDVYENDQFWFSAFGYLQPSTLSLADADLVSSSSTPTPPEEGKTEPYVLEHLKSLPDQFDASEFVAEQRMATSEDGTQVPYFLVRHKDTVMDGDTPTLLYGYGGFEISLTPHYIASVGASWLKRGGAYVEANIRGGGEFGPSWHQAALKENRNKSYEDFIAVGEDLCDSGLCTPKTLAVRGGSNGGLLVGNMLVMRPDLFGAIHCAVPLLDMKRYHTLLAGASWMAEYGDPDKGEFEKFLQKYSPYHNIDPNVEYPPILFTTSTRDDRVHPAHARKMVKKLNDMGKGRWPVYYYENIEGGHGGAADSKQSAFMTALAYDFMFDTLTKNVKKDQ